jgi:hypothetical protein
MIRDKYGIIVPCDSECADRSSSCHPTCKAYLEYLEKHNAAAEEFNRRRKGTSDAMNIRGEGFERYRRQHHR